MSDRRQKGGGVVTKAEVGMVCFKDGKGATSRDHGQLLETGEGMRTSPELEKEPVLQQLDLDPLQTASGSQDCKRVEVCCVVPSWLRWFVRQETSTVYWTTRADG